MRLCFACAFEHCQVVHTSVILTVPYLIIPWFYQIISESRWSAIQSQTETADLRNKIVSYFKVRYQPRLLILQCDLRTNSLFINFTKPHLSYRYFIQPSLFKGSVLPFFVIFVRYKIKRHIPCWKSDLI